jgi:hypothetical protein
MLQRLSGRAKRIRQVIRLRARRAACLEIAMSRFIYAHGFKSREAAEEEISDLYAEGDISVSDRPKAVSYKGNNGKRYYGVELDR